MTKSDDFKDDDTLAAEFALGLLEGEELRVVAQRVNNDAGFAARVTAWEIHFAEITDDIPAQTPSPQSKRDLINRVFPEITQQPIWRKLWLWQAASVASLILLALVFFGITTVPPSTGPLYSAEIVSEAGDFRVVALVDKRSDEIVLTLTAGSAPEGRILQVWAHGPGEPAESVGLWPDGDTVRLGLPPNIAAVDGVLTIGVSEEPPGGSLTGSPSGRVFGTVDIPGVTPAL